MGCDKIIPVSFERIRYFNIQIVAGLNAIKIIERLVNPNIDLVKIGTVVVRNKLDKTKLTNFGKTSGTFTG
jgi:hypothetical protein